jgi:hypothetical protein
LQTPIPHLLNISKTIFWDVDTEKMDLTRSAPLIIERVISLGELDEFKRIVAFYGREKMRSVITNFRHLDPKVQRFCEVYFDIPPTEFRCSTSKLSHPTHWAY